MIILAGNDENVLTNSFLRQYKNFTCSYGNYKIILFIQLINTNMPPLKATIIVNNIKKIYKINRLNKNDVLFTADPGPPLLIRQNGDPIQDYDVLRTITLRHVDGKIMIKDSEFNLPESTIVPVL